MNTILTKTPVDHIKTVGTRVYDQPRRRLALKAWRFLLHFLEMQIPMGLGMLVWHLLVRELRASPSYAAAFQRGSDLSILGHILFMTVPMVAWMVLRQHGWQHSLEMGTAMLAPGVMIIVVCWLGADAYWPWLIGLASPAGTVGMLAYMLYRRDHFTGQAGHSAHTASSAPELSCHTS